MSSGAFNSCQILLLKVIISNITSANQLEVPASPNHIFLVLFYLPMYQLSLLVESLKTVHVVIRALIAIDVVHILSSPNICSRRDTIIDVRDGIHSTIKTCLM